MHFAQHRPKIAAFREIAAVRAMARIEKIAVGERRGDPHAGGFLADHQMNGRLHLVFVIPAFDLFFDASKLHFFDSATGKAM